MTLDPFLFTKWERLFGRGRYSELLSTSGAESYVMSGMEWGMRNTLFSWPQLQLWDVASHVNS